MRGFRPSVGVLEILLEERGIFFTGGSNLTRSDIHHSTFLRCLKQHSVNIDIY